MDKTVTFARILPDGTLKCVISDDSEEVLPGKPIAPIIPEQVEEAVHRGPDLRPVTTEDFQHILSIPHVETLRCALALTQEQFSARYHIPPGTLRDWEQGCSQPDQPACAYLAVIARHPELVRRALQRRARADRSRALASR